MSDEIPAARKKPTLAHRLEYALFRVMEGVLSLASLGTAARAGSLLGLAAWALSPKHRRLVTRNLRIATATEPPDDVTLRRMVRETFVRAGANMIGSQRAATLPPDELRKHIQYEGMEHVLEPVRQGRGVVLVWAHMGNWEVLAQLVREVGDDIRGGPIYRALDNPLLDELTVKRRSQQGAFLFNKHDGFLGPLAFVRDGGVLTVMTDQRAGGHGELCPFFGRLSSCTPLPALVARRTGAAMVTLSITTVGTGQWKLKVRPVPDKAKTPVVIRHLETAMKDQLTDVFWFHDRWRVDTMMPLCFYTKDSPTEAAREAAAPTRFFATLPKGCPEAVAMITTLLELRPDVRIDVMDPGDLPPLPEDPRIVRYPWDPETPEGHLEGFLERCDASHPVPLDFALLLDGNARFARAAKAIGLRSIIGIGPSGKPFTRSFPRPADIEGWRDLAAKLVLTKKARKE
ncbi:lysophospholipid acyltransferase family protein [Luteolibacter luteus]|uniref:Lysophospholipid acyltransferase family protein n=1 Tax=Luteolibacter luteus TaxID=2728835 RepID=A0A858RKQ3_9BACT|nr:lysophospholipid acyltransferase family protein [Luteolibacter luteus]QJE97432.1 lysophospholipid acyltransferase family protein [Luteolibacter luteus]